MSEEAVNPDVALALAEATAAAMSGRTKGHEVTMYNVSRETLALFHGKSHCISGEVIAGLAAVGQASAM
jgi:hypothetical protein